MAEPTTTPPHATNGNGVPAPDDRKLAANRAKVQELILNALTTRKQWMQRFIDPRRDVGDECGYPESVPTAQELQDLHDREAVCARVNECMPKESWQVTPSVYEDEDPKAETEFERAWDALGQQVMGEDNYYQDESGSVVWEVLQRADVQSGIGQYGVILIGTDDGEPLDQPASRGKERHVTFLHVFPETLAQITRFDSDPNSPRHSLPEEYLLSFNDPRNTNVGGVGLTVASRNVHWTRCVHVVDNLSTSRVFGVPRARPVFRRILDLQKVYGADAEAYWKNCLMKLLLETHPTMGDVPIDRTGLANEFEDFANGLQGWAALSGMTGKTIAPAVVDPTAHVAVQVEAICIQLGVPIRVFKGSERGELASSQDDSAWNDRVKARQLNQNTPRVIVPFVNRLIALGVLPAPKKAGRLPTVNRRYRVRRVFVRNAETGAVEEKTLTEVSTVVEARGGFSIEWPDITSSGAAERATVALTRTQAMAAYVGGGVEALLPPLNYLVHEMGMDEEEAKQALDDAQKEQDAKQEEQQALADEHGLVPDVPGFQHPDELKAKANPFGGSGPPQPGGPAQPSKSKGPDGLPTKNQEGDDGGKGSWITTEDGQHLFLKDGELHTSPKGEKLGEAKGNETLAPAPKHEEGHTSLGTTPAGKQRDAMDRILNHPDVLKDLEIPDVMYHVTSAENAEKILKEGLVFGSARASKKGEIRGVYLTDNPTDISKQGGDVGGAKTVTLAVKTKGLNLRLDPEYYYADDKTTKGAKSYVESVNDGEEEYALYSPKSIPAGHVSIRGGRTNNAEDDSPKPPATTNESDDPINNSDEGDGRWVTTDDGNHLFLKDGNLHTSPGGELLGKARGSEKETPVPETREGRVKLGLERLKSLPTALTVAGNGRSSGEYVNIPHPSKDRRWDGVSIAWDSKAAKAERVNVKDLIVSQQGFVHRAGVERELNLLKDKDARPIQVVRSGDRMFVVDGHHRLSAAALAGEGTIKARVAEDVHGRVKHPDVPRSPKLPPTDNQFCPTGAGGGIDPSCGKDGGGSSEGEGDVATPVGKIDTSKPDPKQTLVGRAKELFAAGKARLDGVAKEAYDEMTPGMKRVVDMGQHLEHKAEQAYSRGQALARAVAKERGLSDANVDRVARALALTDAAARWTANIPTLHKALHVLAHVGGPVGFLGAKAAYYVPVASLAYVGYSMGRELAGGRNPMGLISRARAAVRESLAATPDHPAHNADAEGGAMPRKDNSTDQDRFVTDLTEWYATLPEAQLDWAEALVAAAIDEARGDLPEAIRLAKEQFARDPEGPDDDEGDGKGGEG